MVRTFIAVRIFFFAYSFLLIAVVGSSSIQFNSIEDTHIDSHTISFRKNDLQLLKFIEASSWKDNRARFDHPCSWKGITCSSSQASVVRIHLEGEDPNVLRPILLHFPGLQSLEFTSSTGKALPWRRIPRELGKLTNLRRLSLRNNSLKGQVPSFICSLRALRDLDLSENRLTGRLPSCISSLRGLQSINLARSSGEYPIRVLGDSSSRTSGFRVLAEAPGTSVDERTPSDRRLWAILGSVIAVLSVFCGLLIGTFIWWIRRAKNSSSECGGRLVDPSSANTNTSTFQSTEGLLSVASQRHLAGLLNFEYEDLEHATDHFSDGNLIGQGAYGRVYRGTLLDGKEVAIKQLLQRTPTCKKWFLHELLVISSVRHRNLVPLIGCCIDQGFPLLICEYMPNGNLQSALFGRDASSTSSSRKGNGYHGNSMVLPWSLRFRIAVDVARGLQYLHEDSLTGKIVHRDVKPANILLDRDMNAHISDFGLAKLLDHDHGDGGGEQSKQVIVTSVMGTRGYLAPEYVLHGQLSEKVDVYSYGIVLLEIVTGRRGVQPSIDPNVAEPISIDEWAWELLNNKKVEQLADPRLGRAYQVDELVRMVQVSMWCTQSIPEMRPSMGQAMLMLSGQVGVPELPSVRLSWEEFKDFDTSSYGFSSGTTVWASMNDASAMSGYETALATSLPDPKTHHELEERLRLQQLDLGSTDSSSSTTILQVPVNSSEGLSGR